ncbi:unnamed protein product [Periconia digitata]|uniref:Zn(2)-C6 fungal-type domain-containing protein n=1 Tax=Periconia digitata TaxID=1303443 RepID=A0A9W4XP23_9PLEO|nr:unnamed protein product [Periconia digitata]
MPVRKPHSKSRYGCDQCRKRRVKCDEQPPRCNNCITRGESCHFSRVAPAKARLTPQATPSPSSDTTNLEPETRASDATKDRSLQQSNHRLNSEIIRSRELLLMHQWCCYTYKCTSPEWHQVLKEYVGRRSIECDYLMAAVYGFTSLHLAADALEEELRDLPSAREYVGIGVEYHVRALNGLRAALGNISSENASCVLFASILVAAFAVVSSMLPMGPHDETRSAALALLPLVDHIKSIEFVKTQTIPFLHGTDIGKYIDKNYRSPQHDRELCIDELRRLLDLGPPTERHSVYEKAILELEKATRIDDRVADWIADVGSEYLEALREEEPIARAIYMHWGVMLDKLQGNWWAKFVGRRLVGELSAALEDEGPEWRSIMFWCRKEVGLPV